MNKNLKILTITLSAFIIGAVANNFSISQPIPGFKLAVVDVQKVVTASSEVNALKEEQRTKIKDLSSFVEKAKADLAAEKDATKKKALEDTYNKELNVRKNTIDKEYAEKLANIEKNISSVISTKAKQMNYDIVLSKGVVLYGGQDITDNVAKDIK